MSVFPGTFIPTGVGSSAKFSHLVDDLLTPRLLGFRQIHIADEPCELKPDRLTWYVTFGNWLQGETIVIRKNGIPQVIGVGVTTVDYTYGTFQAGAPDIGSDGLPRDVLEASYIFDYFPQAVLEGLITSAVSIINMTAQGPPTSYTVDSAPTAWEGVIVDLAFAMCMEKLLLDYDLWRYRLVFAIGPNEIEGGGGDIAGQLTTLKQNAEQRAEKAMDNPKFKTGNYLSVPTTYYYSAIRGFGASSGAHGVPFITGRLRGWKSNRYM
jgi:hypothetical protein